MSRYFSRAEARAASHREPTAREWALWDGYWTPLLDPLRAWWGGPIRVTSWIRTGTTGSHRDGSGLDISPTPSPSVRPDPHQLHRVASRAWHGGGLYHVIVTEAEPQRHVHMQLSSPPSRGVGSPGYMRVRVAGVYEPHAPVSRLALIRPPSLALAGAGLLALLVRRRT